MALEELCDRQQDAIQALPAAPADDPRRLGSVLRQVAAEGRKMMEQAAELQGPAEVQRLVRREYIEPQTALLQKVENLATYMTDSKAPSARQVDVDTEALVRAEEPIDAFLAREGLQGCIAGPPA